MSTRERSKQDDRRPHIQSLKAQAAEAAAGPMHVWDSDELPSDVQDNFWQSIVDSETAPQTTNFQQLEEAGIELPDPSSLDETQVTSKLWEVIDALARLRVFLSETDHLSDRELYAELWSRVLRDEVPVEAPDAPGAWHVSLLGGWSEEDARLYLQHYADEKWRQGWREEFPDMEIPDHEDPPFDRDARLPQPY